MNHRAVDLVQFLARYSPYLVVPGLWFAYVGGIAPWIGGAAGFGAALLLGIPILVAARRKGRSRDPLEGLLSDG